MEPDSSPVLSKGVSGPHKIQGIGAGFVPSILDRDIIDEVITVTNEEAFATAKLLKEKENLLMGISSGAALCAAIKIATSGKYQNKNIVVIFPDGGDKYMSTGLFDK